MAEQISFPAPIAPPAPTVFRVALLALDDYNDRVIVDLRDWNGTTFGTIVERVMETGPAAVTLMTGLNKANLTVKSLHTRALEWALAKLVTEGRATAGTISGSVP
jgi:hypothetical protein